MFIGSNPMRGTMKTTVMRINTVNNPQARTDKAVQDCMEALMARYPQIKGYQYEFEGEKIVILMWEDQ